MDHVDITNDAHLSGTPVTTLRVNIDSGPTSAVSPSFNNRGAASSPRTLVSPRRQSIVGGDTSAVIQQQQQQQQQRRPTALGCIISTQQWLPDDQASVCMATECQQPFTLFNRKHHCRVCGLVFCAACSSKTIAAVHIGAMVPAAAASATAAAATTLTVPPPTFESPAVSGGSAPVRSPRLAKFGSSAASPANGAAAVGGVGSAAASGGVNSLAGQVQTVRVCNECFFSHQLAIARRPPRLNGELRRRCRGELKMLQFNQLVVIATFLPVHDLCNLALTSSDFYFASRDNQVWFLLAATKKWKHAASAAGINLQSFHSRFSNTHFLTYLHRLEIDRFAGLSSFAASAKLLISSGIKIAVIGPTGIGKTLFVKRFVGDSGNDVVVNKHTTMGFVTYTKRVALAGSLGGEATLTIYDIAGDARYDSLRATFCASSHGVILCYNSASKLTLVQSALVMQGVEPHLKQQPVVVCGLSTDSRPREVTESEAEAASIRSKVSMQVSLSTVAGAFESAVQAVLLVLKRTGTLGVPDPSPLDVLLSV